MIADIYSSLGTELITVVLVAALFWTPTALLVYLLLRDKKAYKEEALVPFTDMPLRPPGESLRIKIDDLEGQIMDNFMVLVIISSTVIVFVLNQPAAKRVEYGAFLFAAVAVVSLVLYRKAARIASLLWDYRLGFIGERVVGEAINQLIAHECKVFHDVPFDNFNVDHVIVGPQGVFAIETKSPRKPLRSRLQRNYVVQFDGRELVFPWGKDQFGILDQAKRQSDMLAKRLSKATGDEVKIQPALALPGWMVNRNGAGTVTVVNPKEICTWISKLPRQQLAPDQIKRIEFQLGEFCRLPKD